VIDGITNVARTESASNIKQPIARKNHRAWLDRNSSTLTVAFDNLQMREEKST
jgi:hypothetical protein